MDGWLLDECERRACGWMDAFRMDGLIEDGCVEDVTDECG